MVVKPPEDGKYYWGTGRRKTAVAQVLLAPNGSGKFKINGKPLEDMFKTPQTRSDVLSAFKEVKLENRFDVTVKVEGGGITGQSHAIRMGIARALLAYDDELRKSLKEHGFLTRDSRKVERKKYGHPKARKSFQYSKR